jgi:anaerobic selenocysteine-containing dehydrogenase
MNFYFRVRIKEPDRLKDLTESWRRVEWEEIAEKGAGQKGKQGLKVLFEESFWIWWGQWPMISLRNKLCEMICRYVFVCKYYL